METAVRLEGVTKTYGATRAVSALSLNVPKGAIFGFIGPNGSGKTTTLRMILHILYPDAGSIEVLGSTSRRAANDRIGYLPEERGLYRKMTVRRVLAYYGGLKGMRLRDARAEADRWLERLGLAGWRDRKVETLSKGMQQKVQFIAAVLNRPDLLILDEPFSGLDPVNLEALREVILELKRRGATVIFSTHDMTKAEELSDTICMIFRGEKVLDGTLEEIQARYGADTVRVRLEGGPGALEGIAKGVRDLGRLQEVRFDGDPQELLRRLLERGRVEHFEVRRPSLHDIFLRIAGDGNGGGAAGAGA
ncbi:MAG TPA: ATP-binding cassette domain-containing protein [Planctomycetota bacterium]|nr:ATP-binding cassette domain-containing protein [Planctomycetota bacterium]